MRRIRMGLAAGCLMLAAMTVGNRAHAETPVILLDDADYASCSSEIGAAKQKWIAMYQKRIKDYSPGGSDYVTNSDGTSHYDWQAETGWMRDYVTEMQNTPAIEWYKKGFSQMGDGLSFGGFIGEGWDSPPYSTAPDAIKKSENELKGLNEYGEPFENNSYTPFTAERCLARIHLSKLKEYQSKQSSVETFVSAGENGGEGGTDSIIASADGKRAVPQVALKTILDIGNSCVHGRAVKTEAWGDDSVQTELELSNDCDSAQIVAHYLARDGWNPSFSGLPFSGGGPVYDLWYNRWPKLPLNSDPKDISITAITMAAGEKSTTSVIQSNSDIHDVTLKLAACDYKGADGVQQTMFHDDRIGGFTEAYCMPLKKQNLSDQ